MRGNNQSSLAQRARCHFEFRLGPRPYPGSPTTPAALEQLIGLRNRLGYRSPSNNFHNSDSAGKHRLPVISGRGQTNYPTGYEPNVDGFGEQL
jgi:hypothetical protein